MIVSKEELLETQQQVEAAFSRKGIKKAVMAYMETVPEAMMRVEQGAELLKQWCESESAYASKGVRKAHISQLNLVELTTDVFVHISSLNTETTLNNLACQLAPMLGFDDTRVGIQACAEIIAVLCETDFYNLNKYHVNSSIYVQSNFALPDDLIAYIERACYLPPMVIKPKTLHNNRSSGYLTTKGDSLILGGSINHHNDPVSLDVLNLMNRYRLTLNEWMLENVDEEPTNNLDEVKDSQNMTEVEVMKAVVQQKRNWSKHLEQSKYFYQHIVMNNNLMYITNKFDKRGRVYSQGHHINPQGTSYKKSIIDLYDKEIINVPEGYFS